MIACLLNAGAQAQVLAPTLTEDMLLRDALDAYGELGYEVVYSSALINSSQRIKAFPPVGTSLIEQIRFLLEPHNLQLNVVRDNYAFVSGNGNSADEPAIKLVSANTPSPPQAANLLEEVWVSSTYRLGAKDANVHYIDHRDFDTLPSAGRDTLRAIATLPGVASNGVSANLRLRGGDENEVLYLLDGQQIIEPFHLKNFQSLFTAINPNVIASANVYASGFSVNQGSRMSGVVDLELHDPDDLNELESGRSTSGSLDVNLVSAALDARGQTGSLTWLASARRSIIDTVIGQLDTDYGKPQFHDELLRAKWGDDANNVRFGLLNFADKISLRDERNFESGNSKFKYTSAWIHWQRDWSTDGTFALKLSHVDADADREGEVNDPLDSIGEIEQSSNYRISKLSIDLANLPWRDIEIQWGGELQYQSGNFEAENSATFGILGNELGKFAQELESEQSRNGLIGTAYISATTTLASDWGLSTGIRYDYQDIDPIHEDVLSFRARLSYTPTENSRFFLDAGRYAQHQNLYELQLDDGKAELDAPQFADQISAGFSHQFQSGALLRIDAYGRNIKDPWSRFENIYNRWVLLPELHADRIEIRATEARVRGFEFSIRQDFSDALTADLSYSYSRAEDKVANQWVDRPWHQEHSLKLGMRWETGLWNIGGFVNYHDGWPTTGRIRAPAELANALYQEAFSSFLSVDLHISRRIPSKHGEILLYADILNSTNEKNTGGYRYRQNNGGIAQTARHLFPVVPVIGVRWRW
ncbi:MAG: TonB-dependent receptor plug domain-containing protein [Pseudomonadales bacterium]